MHVKTKINIGLAVTMLALATTASHAVETFYYPNIQAYTDSGMDVNLDITTFVSKRFNPATDVAPMVKNAAKTVISKYSMERMMGRKKDLEADIKKELNNSLKPFKAEVDELKVSNMVFSEIIEDIKENE